MSADFPFKVGDKVRLGWWNPGARLHILAVGEQRFFAVDENGEESSWDKYVNDWLPYADPIPERWVNVWADGSVGAEHHTRGGADDGNVASGARRIAVIHICPDGTVEVEPC